ncbi:MAG: hypothetical protein NC345_13350 [Lachnospira sp.]|nr:hypothetical protein [Lachnospira sp.]
MEFFNYSINNITSEEVGDRVTFVTADFSTYGQTLKGVQRAFLSLKWPGIKASGCCDEREIMLPEDGRHLAELPIAEWCKRYERDIKSIPDEDLAAEINRRMEMRLFTKSKIYVESQIVIKE